MVGQKKNLKKNNVKYRSLKLIIKQKYLISLLLFFIFPQVHFSNEISLLTEKNSEIKELNLLIEKYILENPEIIIKAIEIYQNQQNFRMLNQEKKLIKNLSSEIFEDKNSYNYGNKDSKITIVEFVDYNCGYCKKNHEIIMRFLKKNNNVRYIVK